MLDRKNRISVRVSAKHCSKRVALILCAAVSLEAGIAIGQVAEFSGRPIVDLIEALRDDGARIVYSADSLPSRLRVTVSPTSSDTFEALREILSPHGLDVELGPRQTWLIVPRSPAPPEPGEDVATPNPALIPPSLETVIVVASRYPIERQSSVSTNSIGRKSIETTPALGQDPLRITHRLPGVASDQLTSRMHVRGGNLDEVLLLLDGVQLYGPYHLKDFQSVFSSIDPRVLESMDVRTGGYEARYGEKMSGVIDMTPIRPSEFRHHEVAVDLLETSILSSGLFGNGRGAWTTSVRRGNLDVLAKNLNSKIGTPQYVDFFNRIEFSPSPGTRIASGILSLDDNVSLTYAPEAAAAADDSDTYFWVSLRRSAPSGLEARYQLATAHLNRTRVGSVNEIEKTSGTLSDTGTFEQMALTAEWTLSPYDSLRINWGATLAQMELDRRVQSMRTDEISIDVPDLTGPAFPPASANAILDQDTRAVHASFRYQPIRRLIVELGARWDDQSLTEETQTSPRFNLRFDIALRTRLRFAWGKFSQPDSLSGLAVADGLTSLQRAQKSRHLILGLEHEFGDAGMFRAEIYEKRYSNLNRRFENVLERVSLLPELLPDRFIVDPARAKTRGVEVSIEGGRERFSWWTNLALSRTQDQLASGWFRRSWDERRSVKVGGEWSGSKWVVTSTLSYRMGWPISNVLLVNGNLIADEYNAVRLPDFSSTDIRASRSAEAGRGEINWYFEISNLFDHSNYCCVDYRPGSSPGTLLTKYDVLLGRVPNVGLRWQF